MLERGGASVWHVSKGRMERAMGSVSRCWRRLSSNAAMRCQTSPRTSSSRSGKNSKRAALFAGKPHRRGHPSPPGRQVSPQR